MLTCVNAIPNEQEIGGSIAWPQFAFHKVPAGSIVTDPAESR
jgi:hypothetical protein